MAEVEKIKDAGVMMLLKHAERQLKNDSNQDIVEEKSDLNYSIPIDRHGLSTREFYKKIKDESYLYGRGTKREADAVTCCSWVITLPKSVSDYTGIAKEDLTILHPEEEKAFFAAVNQFVSDRYGTVFYNRIHQDEGGQPHIHIYFVPQTDLIHDRVRFKTIKTHQEIRTESGKYEYAVRFKLEDGIRIPVKNYAKATDHFNKKISGADVLNKAELKHFHADLAAYLKKNQIPGADSIYTGKTDGKNISVKALKEFTRATGINIEELKEHPLTQEKLKEVLAVTNLTASAKKNIEILNNEAIIHEKEQLLSQATHKNTELKKKVTDLKQALEAKEHELSQTKTRVAELEKATTVQSLGCSTASWGKQSQSAWGDQSQSCVDKNKDIEHIW